MISKMCGFFDKDDKMKKGSIKLSLEYGTYPIWIYDDKGCIVDNDDPLEIKGDVDLIKNIKELQFMYDSLFIDNKVEFRYIGEERLEAIDEIKNLYDVIAKELQEKLGQKYNVKIEKIF